MYEAEHERQAGLKFDDRLGLDRMMEAAGALRQMFLDEKTGIEEYDRLIQKLLAAGSVDVTARVQIIQRQEREHVKRIEGALQLMNIAIKQRERITRKRRLVHV